MRRSALLLLALAAVSRTLGAQSPPATPSAQAARADAHASAPVAQATRTDRAPRIDGRLDDEAWAAAAPVAEFFQMDPSEGAPVSQRTEARILYDADALYVGVRLYDTSPVSSRLGRRDMPIGDSDWVGLVLDSYHDHRTAFSFDLNPAGVRRDELKVGDQNDDSWDPVWEGAATVDSAGWSAEYRIPFSQLRFSSAPEQTWGIQIERVIRRNQEYSVFSFTPKKERGGIARYGHLAGLRDIRPGKRLEVLPYTVARAERIERGANPFRSDEEYGGSAGVDLKYRVSSNLTLDATLNPDFGQVEVDPAVVNLSAFETFYPERRPFFIEGSEVFSFGVSSTFGPPLGANNLFYTRRIGRRPQLRAPSALADLPEQTTILGAAKLSGKTAGGWSLGLLEAVTQREEALFRDPSGADQRYVVEPLTNYLVARARRDLRSGQTLVGGMLGAVSRDLDTDPLRGSLRSGAYAGGVDFRHEWARRAWVATGYLTGSAITGDRGVIRAAQLSPARYYQRPDAEHLEPDTLATRLGGMAGEVSIARQAGRHWRGGVTLATATPGYEINDLGYHPRSDMVRLGASVTYVETRPGKVFRNYRINNLVRFDRNYDGDDIGNTLFVGSNWTLRNYWGITLNGGGALPWMNDRLTRGGPLTRHPADWRVLLGVSSDPRRPVTGNASAYYGEDTGGAVTNLLNVNATVRPSPRWSLTAGPQLHRFVVPAQYVTTVRDPLAKDTYGARYVFAEMEQTMLAMEARLNVTFTPGLSLQLYAQPFLSAADFSDYKELEAARTFDFAVYGEERGTITPAANGTFLVDPDGDGPARSFTFGQAFGQRDFNVRSLRGNAVLRWEWRQGSTLFVAWQQSRSDLDYLGSFAVGRDGRALFNARPDNVFLVKVNYWLNP